MGAAGVRDGRCGNTGVQVVHERGGGGQKGREGQGSGTYLVRCPGLVLLVFASSEARTADVLLFRTSIV